MYVSPEQRKQLRGIVSEGKMAQTFFRVRSHPKNGPISFIRNIQNMFTSPPCSVPSVSNALMRTHTGPWVRSQGSKVITPAQTSASRQIMREVKVQHALLLGS